MSSEIASKLELTSLRAAGTEINAHMDVSQDINPWSVSGAVIDGVQQAIDYDRLIDQFGTRRIDAELLQRFENLTGHRPHRFLRRGLFFSHR